MKLIRESFLGNVNFWVLQWFWIRLTKSVITSGNSKREDWGLMGPVMPFSGWGGGLPYVGRARVFCWLWSR